MRKDLSLDFRGVSPKSTESIAVRPVEGQKQHGQQAWQREASREICSLHDSQETGIEEASRDEMYPSEAHPTVTCFCFSVIHSVVPSLVD